MDLTPAAILAQVSAAVPADLRGNITIIGSLAAGYQLFRRNSPQYVRTKDIDCVLVPQSAAVHIGRSVAERLMEDGWTHRNIGDHTEPGTSETRDADLPAIRLVPPGSQTWFLELLTVPKSSPNASRSWTRVELSTGHFGLPSFRFLPITIHTPTVTEFGISCARPEMMALSNLLEHPSISEVTMSGLIAGRSIKRSNKDLGRAIAIARLSADLLDTWPDLWLDALINCFPNDHKLLTAKVGAGLRALLNSGADLEEALTTCNNGLLAGAQLTVGEFESSAKRLIVFVVEALETRIRT